MNCTKVVIKQRDGSENSPMNGMNAQVFIDGKPLTGATSVNFYLDATGTAEVTIKTHAEVYIEGEIGIIDVKDELSQKIKELKDKVKDLEDRVNSR